MPEKNKRILLIVESPNKVKTLKQFLPNNYVIMASVGHITSIADTGLYNLGIDVNKDFKAKYVVSSGKEDVVGKLKDQVKFADEVILASDPDREGEAISWHLKSTLGIPDNKYKRVTYHEITKKAVLDAIEHPRKIDNNLVDAAKARQKLDKIVGYRLSPISRKYVDAKSVGRCQSAGLKLIVEKEEEIQNFKPEKYYDLYLNFIENGEELKAKYFGTIDKEIKNLKSKEECDKIINECKNNDFIVSEIIRKDSFENPKPPYTTSTYQQDVSKLLGLSIKDSMDSAQKLFEGIDIDGNHIALITYHRTDSEVLSDEFKNSVKSYISEQYSKDLYQGQTKVKHAENAQEGHEAIRPVDVNMTPQKLAQHLKNNRLIKIYELIYYRALQSLLKPAIYDNNIITIKNDKHLFKLQFKNIKYKGFKELDKNVSN